MRKKLCRPKMKYQHCCFHHFERWKAIRKKIAVVVLQLKRKLPIMPMVVHRIGVDGTGMNPLFGTAAGKQQQSQKGSYKRTKKRFFHAEESKLGRRNSGTEKGNEKITILAFPLHNSRIPLNNSACFLFCIHKRS